MVFVFRKADGRHHPGEHLVFTGTEHMVSGAIVADPPITDHQKPGRLTTRTPDPLRAPAGQAAAGARLHLALQFAQGRAGRQPWLGVVRRPLFPTLAPPGRESRTKPRTGPIRGAWHEKRPRRFTGRITIQAQVQMKAQQAAHRPRSLEHGGRIRAPAVRMPCSCFFS